MDQHALLTGAGAGGHGETCASACFERRALQILYFAHADVFSVAPQMREPAIAKNARLKKNGRRRQRRRLGTEALASAEASLIPPPPGGAGRGSEVLRELSASDDLIQSTDHRLTTQHSDSSEESSNRSVSKVMEYEEVGNEVIFL